jgi:hypothetical protein
MIVIKVVGGLGNQLFQYAFARHLSLIHKSKLKLDISSYDEYKLHDYGLGNFNIVEEFYTGDDLIHLRRFKEKHFHFYPDFKKIDNNTYLSGYWQSEHYFKEITEIIKNDFQLKREMGFKDRVIFDEISRTNSVAIHIRRGDYLPGTYQDQVSNCLELSYYWEAIDKITKVIDNPVFFVFSDDSEWAKENLKMNYPVYFVDHNTSETNYQDLRLMSLCKHNIIANSSFSWWGAWLNPSETKRVIAPKIWFGPAYFHWKTEDLYLPCFTAL